MLAAPINEPSACIVIDERLPGMSGLDAIAKLRGLGVETPAILITSHPSRALKRRAAAAGVAIVEKPLMGDALILKVRETLAS
jgi:FixJ family two-component response regulator